MAIHMQQSVPHAALIAMSSRHDLSSISDPARMHPYLEDCITPGEHEL